MSEELKPCPFCGQQDAFVEQLDSDASVVICQGMVDEHSACLARGPVGVQQSDLEDQPGRDAAIAEWNRRAQPAEAEGVEAVEFWVLFDATTPEPYIKKMMPEGFLAFFDHEEDAIRAKTFHPGTDYKRVPYVRQSDHLAALSAVTAERDAALAENARLIEDRARFPDKPDDIGNMIRAHIGNLKAGKEQAESYARKWAAEADLLRKDAERWCYVRLQGDDTHWLNLLRVDLDEFGGNINAAVDALIDGEAPAMSAKEA